jgi:putative ABC transport system permease protein
LYSIRRWPHIAFTGIYKTYAYKTQINWWIYVRAGMISFVLAMLTIEYQSIVAAKTNPVEALKSE